MLMAIIGALFAVAITVLIAQTGMALGFLGGQHAKTKATLSRVSDALISLHWLHVAEWKRFWMAVMTP